MASKARAVKAVAALIEGHQRRFLRNQRRNRDRLLRDSGGGIAGATFWDLNDLEPAEAELAADVFEAFAIALRKFSLGALLQAADRYHHKAHGSLLP